MYSRLLLIVSLVLMPACALAQDTTKMRTDLSEADLARVEAVVAPTQDFSKAEPFEMMSGGGATSTKLVTRDAFSHFSANFAFEDEERFNLGNALFTKQWVASPSSTLASDGLGPLFNARACQSCHLKDGRGHPPESAGDDAISMFLRLSVPPRTESEQALIAARKAQIIPEPVYGGQLQDLAIPGYKGEGRMGISYEEELVTLADGKVISLRRPTYSVSDLGYGPFDAEVQLSPRVAPQMIGMGLLEQIPEADILALADPGDVDGDGVSGKPSWVLQGDDLVLGRLGWKATNPSVRAQTAGAFSGDMGISTPDMPFHSGECTSAQIKCQNAPNGVQPHLGDTEAPDPVLDLVTFYSQNLAVPARRDVANQQVLQGKQLFYGIGCVACHNPKFVTSRDAPHPSQRFQLIWPYTDLLLHDLGEGLADHRPDGDADGYEWRTPPLWGIGLTQAVSGHTYFLHDGRARGLTEAILWHGGEAQSQRDDFMALDAAERQALLTFLESL